MKEQLQVQQPLQIYGQATALLKQAQEFHHKEKLGVEEATFKPKITYPDLPIAILLATDIHYGSIRTHYDLLEKHLKAVEDTPDVFMVSNGDEVDNFNSIFFASGQFENPLPPQLQTLAILDRLKVLDKKKKIGVLSFGNHNDFMEDSGYTWLETFGKELPNTPLFTSGGLLHIKVGKELYDLAMTHTYWGKSKLNPTNAVKRFMDFEYPNADIAFLGHTHQSEGLDFEKGGKDRVAVIGGTYKLDSDHWARKRGIGMRTGQPGHTVLLWPKEHRMEHYKNFDSAISYMRALIFMEEAKKGVTLYEYLGQPKSNGALATA